MKTIDPDLKIMLDRRRYMREMLDACVSCGLCAGSCFFYRNTGDRKSVPSYKVRNTVGKLLRTGGRVSRKELEGMAGLLWGKCALCRQCYCPMGIDLSAILSFGRAVCRSQKIDGGACCDE